MKQLLQVALVLVLCQVSVHAQIPNASFETWSAGEPDGWLTNNAPGVAVTVTQSATPRSGSSALQGTVVSFLGLGSYPPIVQSYFPVSQRFATLSGFYQFAPLGGDSLIVLVAMYSNAGMSFIGAGDFIGSATGASYQPFSAPITYVNNDTPDSCLIYMLISGEDSVHMGSTMLFDDLVLSGTATSVESEAGTPVAYSLDQNYPNPFNPVTTIQFSLVNPQYTIVKVYDMLGEEVATLVNEMKQPGTYAVQWDAGGLASGMYLYRIQAGDFVQTKKLLLLR